MQLYLMYTVEKLNPLKKNIHYVILQESNRDFF